jgi:hypothetical protein
MAIAKNQLIVAFDNGDIVKWNLDTKKFLKVFDISSDYTKRTLLIDDTVLFAGSADLNIYKYTLDGKLLDKKNYSNGTVFKIIDDNNKHLLVAFGNANVALVDKGTLKLIYIKKKHEYLVYSLYFDTEKKLLYSVSDDDSVIIWKISQNGKLEKKSQPVQLKHAIRNIVKYKNNFIITTGDGEIIMFDEFFQRKIFSVHENTNNIISVLLVKNIFISGDDKGNVVIYKINKNSIKPIKHFKMHGLVRAIVNDKNIVYIMSKLGELKKLHLNDIEK